MSARSQALDMASLQVCPKSSVGGQQDPEGGVMCGHRLMTASKADWWNLVDRVARDQSRQQLATTLNHLMLLMCVLVSCFVIGIGFIY